MSGVSFDPRLRNHLGMILRERRSAVRFRIEGMYRNDNYNKWWYLMLSSADTNKHTIGSGDPLVLNHAKTLEFSVYSSK